MSQTIEKINITYYLNPMIPGDNVWSDDGKVFCKFSGTESPVQVGFLDNLELYPGLIYWDIIESGNGYEIRARMKQQSNTLTSS